MHMEGFLFSAVAAKIRYRDRLDLGLIVCRKPAATAGLFTTNQVQAAPVRYDKEVLGNGKGYGRCRAIVVNSGNANACTGQQGMEVARHTAAAVGDSLGISPHEVLVASTGVIGEPLPFARITGAMDSLVQGLAPDASDTLAKAIMTTDSFQKTAVRTIALPGGEAHLLGICKGAGMIMPDMATMLCFIVTDAAMAPELLHSCLKTAVDSSFNRITVDGDTSTNDTVLAMASGMAQAGEISAASPECGVFTEALASLCMELARMIVADGEGGTKVATINVRGAATDKDAERIARTIANSPLVKTAFFGEDPNWGRIIAAAGRSGVPFDQERVAIFFDQAQLVADGMTLGKEAEKKAATVMKQKEFTITIDFASGDGGAAILCCDFSHQYITINADYRT